MKQEFLFFYKIFTLDHPKITGLIKSFIFVILSIFVIFIFEPSFLYIEKYIFQNQFETQKIKHLENLLTSDNHYEKKIGYQFLYELASSGDDNAKLQLALLLYEGRIVKRDILNAKKWIFKISAPMPAIARELIGKIDLEMNSDKYEINNIESEIIKCDKSFQNRDPVELNNSEKLILSLMEIYCKNYENNQNESFSRLMILKEKGFIPAEYFLGKIYLEKPELYNHPHLALESLKNACSKNFEDSCILYNLLQKQIEDAKKPISRKAIAPTLNDIHDQLDMLSK